MIVTSMQGVVSASQSRPDDHKRAEPRARVRSVPATPDALPPVPNLRDLGGLPTADGAITRHGVLYRSGELGALTDAGQRHLEALGLRTIVDLRTEHERVKRPDHVPAGVRHLVADVLADVPRVAPAQLTEAMAEPKRAAAMLSDGAVTRHMEDSYRDFVLTDAGRSAYRQLLRAVAAEQPVLFHCTAGKDRTGWAANLLLWIAGVDEQTRMAEYLAVNTAVDAMFAHIYAAVERRGIDPALMRPLLQVQPGYLRIAQQLVHEHFGGLDGYLEDGLGVDAVLVAQVRAVLRGESSRP
jgi:protein-tyrosine phosphatase